MYLQITSKCNMTCAHCCYSCNKNGEHMDYWMVLEAIKIASQYSEHITIGGGEPTLHPRFFDILKQCLRSSDSVWMATNGSRTKTMFRLSNIIDEEDYPEDENDEYYDSIYAEGKLIVALSQDYYHSPIDQRVISIWKRNKGKNGYEIRNVSGKVIKAGRAIKTEVYQESKGCVCPSVMIRANGAIHACGCKSSIQIGSVYNGIDSEIWDRISEDQKYQDTNCGVHLKRTLAFAI